jgi:uncharacterized protein YkwD
MKLFHASILALALALGASASHACTPPPGAAAMEAELLGWINAQRKAKGLNSLTPSDALKKAARGHACDMADRGYFSHQRKGGPDLAARLRSNGYRYRAAAENIAKTGAPDPNRTAQIWRDSPGHWKNILNPKVTEIGLATASDGGRTYWVMNVGKRR